MIAVGSFAVGGKCAGFERVRLWIRVLAAAAGTLRDQQGSKARCLKKGGGCGGGHTSAERVPPGALHALHPQLLDFPVLVQQLRAKCSNWAEKE
jgi:hypothetical protein